MAASAQLTLRNAVAALFSVAPALAEGRVYKDRDFALANGVSSQVHVNFEGSEPLDLVIFTDHPRDWSTDIELVFLARKTGSDEASDVADALWVEAYARVMADQTLGDLAYEIVPGAVQVEPGEGDTSLCRLTWRFACKHRTSNNSI